MKIYTEFNPATWLRMVKFTELNIELLSFRYISHHRNIYKNPIKNGDHFTFYKSSNRNENSHAGGYDTFTDNTW